jgi:hypothetical protein
VSINLRRFGNGVLIESLTSTTSAAMVLGVAELDELLAKVHEMYQVEPEVLPANVIRMKAPRTGQPNA